METFIYTYRSGRIEIEIQGPDIPENLDKYIYSDGVWKQPEPVKTYSSFFAKFQERADTPGADPFFNRAQSARKNQTGSKQSGRWSGVGSCFFQ